MIAFIGDFRDPHPLGGASLVDDFIFKALRSRGEGVTRIPIYGAASSIAESTAEQNTVHLVSVLTAPSIGVVMDLIKAGRPYVLFRHDIPNYVLHPSRIPKEVKSCIDTIFRFAAAVIFISPLQKQLYDKTIYTPHWAIVPPPIDLSIFRSDRRSSPTNSLYLGQISRIRGVLETVKHHRSITNGGVLSLCGPLEEPDLLDQLIGSDIRLLKHQNRTHLPNLFSEHRRLIHIPQFVDSFCLKIIEAELCGLEIICPMQLVGRYSYNSSLERITEYIETRSCVDIFEILDLARSKRPTVGKLPAGLI